MSYKCSNDNNVESVISDLTNGGCNCPVYNCPPKPNTCCNGNGLKNVRFNPNNIQPILTYADTVFDVQNGESTSIGVPFRIPLGGPGARDFDTVIHYTACDQCCNMCNFVPGPDAEFNVCSAEARILSVEPARQLSSNDIKVNCDSLFADQSLDKESANFYQLYLGTFDPSVDNAVCPTTQGRNASISIKPYKLKYIIQYTICGTVTDEGQTYKFFIQTRNKRPFITEDSVLNFVRQICIPKQASIFAPYVNLLFNYEVELVDCVRIKEVRRGPKPGCNYLQMDEENGNYGECGDAHENFGEIHYENDVDDIDDINALNLGGHEEFGLSDDDLECGRRRREGRFEIVGTAILEPTLHAEAVRPEKVVTIANVIPDPNYPTTIAHSGRNCRKQKMNCCCRR